MKNLLKHYKLFLKSMHFDTNEDDYLVYPNGKQVAFTYNKVKRNMVLPTPNVIDRWARDGGSEEEHAFHPMCESALEGESGTIRFIKSAMKSVLWSSAMELIDTIITTQAEGKKGRDNSYKRFLNKVCKDIKEPVFDAKLVSSWEKFVSSLDPEWIRKKGVTIYLSSNLKIDGVKYFRVLTYGHAFEEIDNDDAVLLGVKLARKQDKAIIVSLLKTVFGWFPEEVGSNDGRPFYGALLRAWAVYVQNYNKIVSRMKDICPLEPLEDGWIEDIDDLKKFDDLIQTLPFNTGPVVKNGTVREFKLTDSRHTQVEKPSAAPTATEIQKAVEILNAVKTTTEEPSGPPNALDLLDKIVKRKEDNRTVNGVPVRLLSPAERELYSREDGIIPRKETVGAMSLSQALGIKAEDQNPRAKGALTPEQIVAMYNPDSGYSIRYDMYGNIIDTVQQPTSGQTQLGGTTQGAYNFLNGTGGRQKEIGS